MDIDIRVETADEFDATLTSALAREAFRKHGPELSAERFSWTYGEGYDRVTVVSAFADGFKIGQLACFFKTFVVAGKVHDAAELADLFVSPQYRGFKVASSLYREMKKVIAAEGVGLMFAYANEGASILNRKFFDMEEVTQLPARFGFASPFRSGSGDVVVHTDVAQIAEACIRCADRTVGGVELSYEQLRSRLGSPVFSYLCATDGEVAVIASPRVIRSVPLLLICATFGRQAAARNATGAMTDRLCHAAGRRAFLYPGWNDAVALSGGFSVPQRLLKGKFLIQSNCLDGMRSGIGRFEMLDVDYG